MLELQQDNYGSYKNFGSYKIYTNGDVRRADTDKLLKLEYNGKRIHSKRLYVNGFGCLDVGKIVAWLYLLDTDDIDYDDFEIEYLDGDMTNCAVENIKLVSNVGRPSKYLYLVKKGDYNYVEYTRTELGKYLERSASWIDAHIDTDEPFLWNGALYTITDDIFKTWQYM